MSRALRRRPNMTAEEGPVEHIKNALAILIAHRDLGGTMERADYDSCIARLRRSVEQLDIKGYRHNPTLAILGGNPRRARRRLANPTVEDATRALWAKLEYIRPDDPDGDDIVRVHEFKDGFEIAWLSDGSVQLQHPAHPLWMEDGT